MFKRKPYYKKPYYSKKKVFARKKGIQETKTHVMKMTAIIPITASDLVQGVCISTIQPMYWKKAAGHNTQLVQNHPLDIQTALRYWESCYVKECSYTLVQPNTGQLL